MHQVNRQNSNKVKIHDLDYFSLYGSYEWIIIFKKCGRLDLPVFNFIWVIGTYDNRKNRNPRGRFEATS